MHPVLALTVAGAPFAFHIGETTVSIPFGRAEAEKLSGSIQSLLETFAEKQKAERPKRWNMMEYKLKGAVGGSKEHPVGCCEAPTLLCDASPHTNVPDTT